MRKTIAILALHAPLVGSALSAAAHDDQAPQPATFNRDIAPIIFGNCASCHRPNQAGPFSLLNYDDVRKRGRQIAEVTHSRFMPPWLPEPLATGGGLVGERRLSEQQIALIAQWVKNGMPEGDPKDLSPLPEFADDAPLGPPDVMLTMDEPFTVPAEAGDDDLLRSFVLPVNVLGDRWVKAVEYRPANPRLIHHASFLIDVTGNARLLDAADPLPGYPGMGTVGLNQAGSFGGFAPGAPPLSLPKGFARRLPQECDFVLELHVNPTGKPETEQASIGFHFADEPIQRLVTPITLAAPLIDIPAGEQHYQVSDALTLPVDASVIGLSPHAHYICQTIHITATPPPTGNDDAGPAETITIDLLRINDWDFNWQQPYQFQTPVDLPAGTRIEMTFTYDNSAGNPRNLSNPPVRVRTGHRAVDEMALLFLHVAPKRLEDLPALEGANREHQIERLRALEQWKNDQPKRDQR